jgi:hypothetical protein
MSNQPRYYTDASGRQAETERIATMGEASARADALCGAVLGWY